MKKFPIIILAIAALVACEKDNENHYTVRRLASFEESNADGSEKRVDTYTYDENGYSVESTLDDVVTSLVKYSDAGDSLVVTTSKAVDGSLQLYSTAVTTYLNESRNDISSVKTVYEDGSPTRLETYAYENSICTVTVTEGGAPVSMREITSLYNGTTVSMYDYDSEADEWVYAGREDYVYSDYLHNTLASHSTYNSEDILQETELYSYDQDSTTVITYVKEIPTLKSVYVSSGLRVVFQRYKANGSSWTSTSNGCYIYEYVTI